MILCVTPNAAIDRTLIVPDFQAGLAFRPANVLVAAGGKGLNVARTIRRLGGDVRCAGILRGHGGRLIAELAEREGLHGGWTWLGGETRICTIIVDSNTHQTTELYEYGPPISVEETANLLKDVLREAALADAVCISGTLPPGAPPDALPNMINELQTAGRPVWLDTSGAALAASITAKPYGVKINAAEAGQLLSREIVHVAAARAAAIELIKCGVRQVVVTLGPQGAILADVNHCWWGVPPAVEVVSAVGSGDALLAGLVHGVSRGLPAPEALRHGVAAGAANATAPGGGAFSSEVMAVVLAETTVKKMAHVARLY